MAEGAGKASTAQVKNTSRPSFISFALRWWSRERLTLGTAVEGVGTWSQWIKKAWRGGMGGKIDVIEGI